MSGAQPAQPTHNGQNGVQHSQPGQKVIDLTNAGPATLDARNVSAWFSGRKVLERASLTMEARRVTALIGPSGCGKSTFIRTLNRMHENIPGAQVGGEVFLDGEDIYGGGLGITRGSPAHRDGLPEAEPLPLDVDRPRTCSPAIG